MIISQTLVEYLIMSNLLDGHFYNPTKGDLSAEEVIKEVIRYISEKPENFYDIVVGCDSSSEENPTFPVVLAVLRTGEGGRFFLKRPTNWDSPRSLWGIIRTIGRKRG